MVQEVKLRFWFFFVFYITLRNSEGLRESLLKLIYRKLINRYEIEQHPSLFFTFGVCIGLILFKLIFTSSTLT